jgi:glutamine amidotransferase
MKAEVDIVEFNGGNVGSVQRCMERLEIGYRTVSARNLPDGSRPLVVPGVGSFGGVMSSLKQDGLDEVISSLVKSGTPYIGICVGMQILFESSEESPEVQGLGLLKGKVVRFVTGKVPLIGWNEIQASQDNFENGYVYFVNSYFPKPADESAVLYSSDYSGPFCAAVRSGNITGFQFHPEKSGTFGNALLKRTVEDACRN